MFFRKATLLDTSAVTAIYDGARRLLKESGIPQWQEGVPGRESFITDVQNGVAFVIEDEGKVVATVQIIDREPYYDNMITGAWRDENALVAHRVAVSVDARKHGLGSMCIENAEKIALQRDKTSLRLDTHEKNFRMRKMLEKNGFVAVGTVAMPDGSPRIAYEKIIK